MLTLVPLPDLVQPRRPSRPARERKRLYRQRQACGVMSVPVEIDAKTLDWLIGLEWLTEAEAADPRAVGAAVGRVLADSASRK